MQHSQGLRAIGSAVVIALTLLLCACRKSSPEQAVRLRIEAMQQAIDQRDAGAVEDLLAADFIGNDGLDRRGARQLAAGVFLRHRAVRARIGKIDVDLRGSRDAIARFPVLVTGGGGGLLPQQGQAYRVETGWRLLEGEWRLRSARWEPVLQDAGR